MPKPVLSDSLFNADDVATAVLQEANLQVTNSDLGVVDRTSLFSAQQGYGADGDNQAYSFNGFMFVSMIFYNSSGASNQDTIASISNSDFYPVRKTYFNTISYQGDSAYRIRFETNGTAVVDDPNNLGTGIFYITLNGWYRYA